MKSDKVFADRFRYFILGIAFCCLMSISSNISAFNIAQVCMANEGPAHESNISVNGHEKARKKFLSQRKINCSYFNL